MVKLKAILIDLDDTLVTDDAVSQAAWQKACERFQSAAGHPAAAIQAAILAAAERYWRDPENHRRGRLDLITARRGVVGAALRTLGKADDKLGDAIADAYTAAKEAAIDLVPGARETLGKLRRSGLKLALVTNGSTATQRRKIEGFGLRPFFDRVHIEGETGIGKPQAGAFQQALHGLGVAPGEACMVGDDLERDIAGAKALGIYGVWVDWRRSGLPPGNRVRPDHVIHSFAGLPDVPVVASALAETAVEPPA
jgi:putative hydrolase of the HAD superfamily